MNIKWTGIAALSILIAACTEPNAPMQDPHAQKAPEAIALKASNGKYVCTDFAMEGDNSGILMASKDEMGTYESLTVRDLGGGRVAFKAFNGKYVSADQNNNGKLVANRDSVGDWETFEMVDMGSGKVAIRGYGSKYVTADLNYEAPLSASLWANRDQISDWEMFSLSGGKPAQ